jgi:hypothetical protein
MLFADNFDYQDINDFVRGVLAADEVGARMPPLTAQLEQHKIYSHVLTRDYAARVGNLYSYEAVRWVGLAL